MAHWLFKEEPTHYSFDDLVRDGKTVWDGIRNNLALKHLREVKKGDRVLYYHTGKEKAVVGVMAVTRGAYPDPQEQDERLVVVEVKPVARLARPVTLATLKADKRFGDFPLVRISRLSVMPVTADQWKGIEEIAAG
jgi:predicted RNA-binding protein with PUA-like domain